MTNDECHMSKASKPAPEPEPLAHRHACFFVIRGLSLIHHSLLDIRHSRPTL